MSTLLILLITLPLGAAIICFVTPYRVARALTVVVSIACVAFSIVLIPAATTGTVEVTGYLRLDAVGCVFLLATTALFALTSIYAVGYFGDRARSAAGSSVSVDRSFRRYSARFYAGFNIFAWSMICAPLVNGLALLWIAVEITTVVSALLVALDNTDEAAEAAWKYVLIASSGLGIALLATIMLYYAGATALGSSYDLAFAPLLDAAKHLPSTPVQFAFALAVVGYGTKVGLFPVHTWLPDAHSEAPTPVSALLSGALLATSFYAIVRYFQVAVAALGPTFPQTMLLIFGVLSLLLAALYLFDQKNLKRMLAYSSIEHMGILAIGVSFGTPSPSPGCYCMSWVTRSARARRSWAPGCSSTRTGRKSSAGSGMGSGCCPGRRRCSCWRSSRSARCRRSASSAASSRSSSGAFRARKPRARRRWCCWSRSRSSGSPWR
ncbi:hydrogenase 4 subunit F (plasmid) [Streptomyces sp. L7]